MSSWSHTPPSNFLLSQPGVLEERGSKAENGPAAGLILLLVVWLIGTYLIMTMTNTAYRAFMLMGILTALVLPLAIQHLREGVDIFEPLVFANLSLGSMFLGRCLYDIQADNWFDHWFGNFFDVLPGFDTMLRIALIGTIALQIGYCSRVGERIAARLPRFQQGMSADRSVIVALCLFGLGFVLFAGYILQSGGIGFLIAFLSSHDISGAGYSAKAGSGYLATGPLLWPPAGMIMFSAWISQRRRWHLVVTIVIMVLFFGTTVGSGSRTLIIQGVLGMAGIWYIARNKRPSLLLILPAVALGLFFTAYTRESRQAVTLDEKLLVLSKMASNPGPAIIAIWSQDDAAEPDYFSEIVSNVPSRIPFAPFTSVTDIFLRAYPRFLFPYNVKPDENVVAVFKYFFPHVEYRYSSGAACTIIAEFYLDSGTISVFIGMLVLGIVLAIPKPWLRLTHGVLPTQIFYVVMPAYTTSLMRGGLPAFVTYIAITGITVALLAFFAKTSNRVALPA